MFDYPNLHQASHPLRIDEMMNSASPEPVQHTHASQA